MPRCVKYLCICALLISPSLSYTQPPEPPRLTVVVVVDQFRHEFLTRFKDLFIEGGYLRVMNEGAWFTDATYGHMHASTSPGHSVITSGTYGYRSGLIGNSWFDRDWGVRRKSLVDPDHRILGKAPDRTGRSSPREILGSTLADELRMATNFQGKYFATSLKDYSAMVSAGKLGSPLWYEASLGRFTSSDFYMEDVPDWVKAFNARGLPDSYFGKQWKRLLSAEVYEKLLGRDDRPNEENNRSAGITFPHTITGGEEDPGVEFWNSLKHTPWADEILIEFARELIVNEQLGQDEVPDILVVSLGSVDYTGHDYGPFSHEALDAFLRIDRQLKGFFEFLDERVGFDRMLLIMTGDHGAVPLPEELAKQGIPTGRVSPAELTAHVDAVLDDVFGPDDWILHLYETGLYLNYDAVDRHGITRDEVAQVSADAMVTHPGISAAIPRSRIINGELPDTPLFRRVTRSFFPDKSGDVIPVATPFYLILDEYSQKPYGTTHGQPHEYDVHVPLIFYGPWVKPGKYYQPVDMADVTPTICQILGITMPSSRDGKVLGEILK